MIVVSNTSPLNYLILIEEIGLLPKLFGQVLIPESVISELLHPKASEAVRAWAASPPSWADIRAPRVVDHTIELDTGERDAICVALEAGAERVLMDDARACRLARERGLEVTRTGGVLVLARERNLIDFPRAIERLRTTSYRIPEETIRTLLEQHSERERRQGADSERSE